LNKIIIKIYISLFFLKRVDVLRIKNITKYIFELIRAKTLYLIYLIIYIIIKDYEFGFKRTIVFINE